jgi:hypothetical protein
MISVMRRRVAIAAAGTGVVAALGVLTIAAATASDSGQGAGDTAAYVAYYWKARPGRLDEYNAYIRLVAERIDEDARKAGVFLEVTTVVPGPNPDGPAPEWTHLRIFKLRNLAAVAGLGPGLDAATQRVVPDEAQRKANSARSAELRDAVRREVWTALH